MCRTCSLGKPLLDWTLTCLDKANKCKGRTFPAQRRQGEGALFSESHSVECWRHLHLLLLGQAIIFNERSLSYAPWENGAQARGTAGASYARSMSASCGNKVMKMCSVPRTLDSCVPAYLSRWGWSVCVWGWWWPWQCARVLSDLSWNFLDWEINDAISTKYNHRVIS